MLIVDGANVVGSIPDGWWRDRAGAADRLIARIGAAVGAGRLRVAFLLSPRCPMVAPASW